MPSGSERAVPGCGGGAELLSAMLSRQPFPGFWCLNLWEIPESGIEIVVHLRPQSEKTWTAFQLLIDFRPFHLSNLNFRILHSSDGMFAGSLGLKKKLAGGVGAGGG